MKIPGPLYVLVGAFVVWFSYFTISTSKFEIAQFQLFIWLGYAFMVVGGFKTLWWLITRTRRKKVNHHPVYHGSHHQSAMSRFCEKCGQEVHDVSNFCHTCGNRIMHRR